MTKTPTWKTFRLLVVFATFGVCGLRVDAQTPAVMDWTSTFATPGGNNGGTCPSSCSFDDQAVTDEVIHDTIALAENTKYQIRLNSTVLNRAANAALAGSTEAENLRSRFELEAMMWANSRCSNYLRCGLSSYAVDIVENGSRCIGTNTCGKSKGFPIWRLGAMGIACTDPTGSGVCKGYTITSAGIGDIFQKICLMGYEGYEDSTYGSNAAPGITKRTFTKNLDLSTSFSLISSVDDTTTCNTASPTRYERSARPGKRVGYCSVYAYNKYLVGDNGCKSSWGMPRKMEDGLPYSPDASATYLIPGAMFASKPPTTIGINIIYDLSILGNIGFNNDTTSAALDAITTSSTPDQITLGTLRSRTLNLCKDAAALGWGNRTYCGCQPVNSKWNSSGNYGCPTDRFLTSGTGSYLAPYPNVTGCGGTDKGGATRCEPMPCDVPSGGTAPWIITGTDPAVQASGFSAYVLNAGGAKTTTTYVASGDQITTYKSASAATLADCEAPTNKEVRTCDNGKLSGLSTAQSCTPLSGLTVPSCSLTDSNGTSVMIPNGGTIAILVSDTPQASVTCSSQSNILGIGTCSATATTSSWSWLDVNGATITSTTTPNWSWFDANTGVAITPDLKAGGAFFLTCGAPCQTTVGTASVIIKQLSTLPVYSQSTAATGTTCASSSVTMSCDQFGNLIDPRLSNTAYFLSCTEASCLTADNVTLANGWSGTLYSAANSTSCPTIGANVSCKFGVLSSTTNTYAMCGGLPCSITWKDTGLTSPINSGTFVTAYQTGSVPYYGTCNSQNRLCLSGVLSGSFAFQACTVGPVPTPAPATAPKLLNVSLADLGDVSKCGNMLYPLYLKNQNILVDKPTLIPLPRGEVGDIYDVPCANYPQMNTKANSTTTGQLRFNCRKGSWVLDESLGTFCSDVPQLCTSTTATLAIPVLNSTSATVVLTGLTANSKPGTIVHRTCSPDITTTGTFAIRGNYTAICATNSSGVTDWTLDPASNTCEKIPFTPQPKYPDCVNMGAVLYNSGFGDLYCISQSQSLLPANTVFVGMVGYNPLALSRAPWGITYYSVYYWRQDSTGAYNCGSNYGAGPLPCPP